MDERAVMTPEQWEINKNCEAKARNHKWMWDENRIDSDWAVCVHCGKRELLSRKVVDGYDQLGIERK